MVDDATSAEFVVGVARADARATPTTNTAASSAPSAAVIYAGIDKQPVALVSVPTVEVTGIDDDLERAQLRLRTCEIIRQHKNKRWTVGQIELFAGLIKDTRRRAFEAGFVFVPDRHCVSNAAVRGAPP